MSELKDKIEAIPYWYHKVKLPDGEVTPGWAPLAPERYCIPEDMTGMRVLDIGAWDGYWTWEALKRGASEVVAIDDFSDSLGPNIPEAERSAKWAAFDLCREAFGFIESDLQEAWINQNGQRVSRKEMSVYDVADVFKLPFAPFDVVFFFGTIYHLKHPLLALEKISEVCDGAIYIETASLDEFSPYKGEIGRGFNRGETVMEFYPGDQYGSNHSNWWVPTLQCLGSMLASVGFKDINAWPLTEEPKGLPECRGFASGAKDPGRFPACRPDDIGTDEPVKPFNIAAVMSVPRLGFTDNMNCTFGALSALGIPLINIQGAFCGQCLERGLQSLIDQGHDMILTIDYDTVYTKQDVESLVRLMHEHPEASAVVPIQIGRGQNQILTSFKTVSGQPKALVDRNELRECDVAKIATGHFGLTLIRVSDLMDLPHPWFKAEPNCDNQWGPGRIDDDIWFWKLMEKQKKTVLLANRVVVGHLELLCTLPDEDLRPTIHMLPTDFDVNGKPENVWK